MSTEPKNIDQVLVQDMQEYKTNSMPQPVNPESPSVSDPATSPPSPVDVHQEEQAAQVESKTEEIVPHRTEPELDNSQKGDTQKGESPIDEYGNPVAPPKTYTEDEVNRMIRERLARGRQTEAQPARPIDQPTNPSAEGEQDWQKELKTFVKKTYQEITKEQQEDQWRVDQQHRQAEFEEKFTTGMSKYPDFQQVTQNAPITSSMMMAARGLDNPAAFVYGAVKLYPQEVAKIAQMSDPYLQAAEIGRLHERMVKTRSAVSNAPKPIEAPKGDMTPKPVDARPSIDQRINEYAKVKRR